MTQPANAFALIGDGTLLRVSADQRATITRTATTDSKEPLLTIGAGARIVGDGVILDSTYGTLLDPTTVVKARTLALGSGQISILLDPQAGPLAGSVVDPHLQISGQFLEDVQHVERLTLRSYRTIDFYGDGSFGGSLGALSLVAGGIRGFDHGAGTVEVAARRVSLSNPSNVAALTAPAVGTGAFEINADTLVLGSNGFSVTGFENLGFTATGGVLGQGAGAFSTLGNLTITTPIITAARGSVQSVTAGGAIELAPLAGKGRVVGGLGANFSFTGTSIAANTRIELPSGELLLRATTDDVTVGGALNVAGTAQQFYDLTRFSDAGTITLTADAGDVSLLAGSNVSVAAAGLGNAGFVEVNAGQGAFTIDPDATLAGGAVEGRRSGSFVLDAGTLPSFTGLAAELNASGFFQERNLRIRTGDIVIADPAGGTNIARNFVVSADTGSIHVIGTIDASGETGGKIVLAAGGDLVLENGAVLTAHAEEFSNAGKGGEIRLEAGAAINGVANAAALLDVQAGSTINLGVDAFVPGSFTTVGSSAWRGQFTGTLHLRAPRTAVGVQVGTLAGNINGASSVLVEAFKVYDRTATGTLDTTLRTTINTEATTFMNANEAAIRTALLAGAPDPAGLDPVLVVAPGVEIINRTGDLALGMPTSLNTVDWDLSGFRYGTRQAPGVLTLRAAGNLVFNNTLSDGFTPVTASAANGHSTMWLAQLMNINANLPVNTQSWSYRLAAGADLGAVDFRAVSPSSVGSVFVGQFYAAIPNSSDCGAAAAVGPNGVTANSIRISTNNTNTGTRFEVIRTGTGDIEIAAAGDVQLRNQFATIYTAGVRLPDPTQIFAAGDFVRPIVERPASNHAAQGELGAPQQNYTTQWSMAGGDVSLAAGGIGRFTFSNGAVVADSTRQVPGNWLYRRGYVDPSTGRFGVGGVVVDPGAVGGVTDPAASTTWWIDFSNFFQGIGALGGGDVTLQADSDITNADAVIPTNARMAGRDPVAGVNLAPDANRMLELGGGDLTIRAGGNIDGGIYYVERGAGELFAGGAIKTNAARSPSRGLLGSSVLLPDLYPSIQSVTPEVFDPLTWLPTTLFAGKSSFDVAARGDVLLGPTVNPFLLPQGINNKFWYKTYFDTFSAEAGVSVASFGGSVTHRLAVTMPGEDTPRPILDAWYGSQNLFTGVGSVNKPSNFQPWIRLAELDLSFFDTIFTVTTPSLRSTAFARDVNIVGRTTLFPSPTSTIELAANGAIVGLQPTGKSRVADQNVTVWTSAALNLSDANPAAGPGIVSPLAYQGSVGNAVADLRQSSVDPFSGVDPLFQETGSFTGNAASIVVKQSLHDAGILHAGDANPLRLYAGGGDITGLTLFSPKAAQVFASNDISDVAFYIQNVGASDISIVSAGRDIVPNNENAPIRSLASDATRGNYIGDTVRSTVTGASTKVLAGDIQISGPGVLEVLAGRNLDLGAGANFADGTGVGITSIGNFRNPFLPFDGASIIALAGVGGPGGKGAAQGLSKSSLDFEPILVALKADAGGFASTYLDAIDSESDLDALTDEQQSIVGLEFFFRTLRDAGRATDYDAGYAAIDALFGTAQRQGEVFTRARDIRTSTGGAITIGAPGGGLTLASDIFGNPLTPPGIVTEFGGPISIFTNTDVDIGQARIFTLRGGDILMWSSEGDIAAGTAAKTVVTAPPTRVVIDATSADVQTDFGGLATGGGIGVLAAVEGVAAGNVDLIAPNGIVDAGDAGIRATGNLSIAAVSVLNASNIAVSGNSAGVPSTPSVAAPSLGSIGAANNAASAQSTASNAATQQARQEQPQKEELPSIVTVEVLGYGGASPASVAPALESITPPGSVPEEDEEEKRRKRAAEPLVAPQ